MPAPENGSTKGDATSVTAPTATPPAQPGARPGTVATWRVQPRQTRDAPLEDARGDIAGARVTGGLALEASWILPMGTGRLGSDDRTMLWSAQFPEGHRGWRPGDPAGILQWTVGSDRATVPFALDEVHSTAASADGWFAASGRRGKEEIALLWQRDESAHATSERWEHISLGAGGDALVAIGAPPSTVEWRNPSSSQPRSAVKLRVGSTHAQGLDGFMEAQKETIDHAERVEDLDATRGAALTRMLVAGSRRVQATHHVWSLSGQNPEKVPFDAGVLRWGQASSLIGISSTFPPKLFAFFEGSVRWERSSESLYDTLVVSPDRRLAATRAGKVLTVWRLVDGRAIAEVRLPDGVLALNPGFSARAKHLTVTLSRGLDCRLALFRIDDGVKSVSP